MPDSQAFDESGFIDPKDLPDIKVPPYVKHQHTPADSQEPTCLCYDPIFFNEPCPAHPKPDSQARDELVKARQRIDSVLNALKYGEIEQGHAISLILGKIQPYAERLAAEQAIEELKKAWDQYAPGDLGNEYMANRIVTLSATLTREADK